MFNLLSSIRLFVLAIVFGACLPAPLSMAAGAGLPEDLTPSEKRAWAMKILKARLEKGGSESDAIQKGWLQMKLAHIAFSGEPLMTEESRSALSGLGEMAAELVPEAQRELFKMASRKEAPFAARLGALEILLESQKAGNFSDELARFEALEAARAHLEIKSSERESRLTALLFDIVSGLSEPSPQLQEGLALLAISKNPYQKSLPRAALEALSRSGYDETIALRLARGLESLIVPSKMQMLIAEELAEKHFPLIEPFLIKSSLFQRSGSPSSQAAGRFGPKQKSRRPNRERARNLAGALDFFASAALAGASATAMFKGGDILYGLPLVSASYFLLKSPVYEKTVNSLAKKLAGDEESLANACRQKAFL